MSHKILRPSAKMSLICHPERRAQPAAEGSAGFLWQISPLPPVGRNDNWTAGLNDKKVTVLRLTGKAIAHLQ